MRRKQQRPGAVPRRCWCLPLWRAVVRAVSSGPRSNERLVLGDMHMVHRTPAQCKQCLVGLGLYALSQGHWHMVMAITRLIQRKGLSRA